MASYRRVFTVENVGHIHQQFGTAIRLAEQLEREYARLGMKGRGAPIAREYLRAYADFNRRLDDVAQSTAADARLRIRAWIQKTKRRPDTRMAPHLRDAIVCRPVKRFGTLGTGEVGIADIGVLDQLVNPISPEYGPYWRAQELGSSRMVGRQVYGGFFGPGMAAGPFRPDPQYRGVKGAPHPVFVTSRKGRTMMGAMGHPGGMGKRGGAGGGRMTIRTPLRPRLFIKRGADAQEVIWRQEIAAVEQAAANRLRHIARMPLRP